MTSTIEMTTSALLDTDAAARREWHAAAMERLLLVVQQLSQARDLDAVTAIVRDAARELTGADGATFVLRDGEYCFYADENAISPLWKGSRFPLHSCISGWAMLNAQSTVIEDIYADPRIPADAYRPTFVKSLAMVPIRRSAPIGAIGNYWAHHRLPTPEEVDILQALADTASVAIQNAALYAEREGKVRDLRQSNYELSRFAWVASHDLQEPLRTLSIQLQRLKRRAGEQLDEQANRYIDTATESARRLQDLIEALLVHAHAEKKTEFELTPLSGVVQVVLANMSEEIAASKATITTEELPVVLGDSTLLAELLRILLSNALKFRREDVAPDINIGCERQGPEWRCSVRDNGLGIEQEYHESIFGLVHQLHSREVYPGLGIGLATSRKILGLHGGRIWVESEPGVGSTFYYTLPVQ